MTTRMGSPGLSSTARSKACLKKGGKFSLLVASSRLFQATSTSSGDTASCRVTFFPFSLRALFTSSVAPSGPQVVPRLVEVHCVETQLLEPQERFNSFLSSPEPPLKGHSLPYLPGDHLLLQLSVDGLEANPLLRLTLCADCLSKFLDGCARTLPVVLQQPLGVTGGPLDCFLPASPCCPRAQVPLSFQLVTMR